MSTLRRQAVAEDTIFGPFLEFVNKGTVRNNPISAVIATCGFIQLCFLIGRHVSGV